MSAKTVFTQISFPYVSASTFFNHNIAESGCAPVRINVPPPVLDHSPATGELDPFNDSSPFANSILDFFFLIISAALTIAGAYTKFSAYINFLPDLLTRSRSLSNDFNNSSYICALDTLSPIGSLSPALPK